jgi:RND family efflux transporter MFP subunit
MNIQDAVRSWRRSGSLRKVASSSSAIIIAVAALILLRTWLLHATTQDAVVAVPVVLVAKVDREDLSREISVPAEFRPYTEVDLHAKVAGYVIRMNVDIGDKVKTGELLAVLEVPELGEDLNHAIAAQQRAAAEYRDSHLAYTRLVAVNKDHPNLIAQQDLDTAEAKDDTAKGAVAAASADFEKDRTLVAYTRITAPFDGVITRRYADPGALIQAGTASQTQTMPLVRLSDNYRLRLDFPVSVDYAQGIRVGDSIIVRVDSRGGATFTGRIARFTHMVDESTRTMTAEMEVDNPSLDLIPGMYATVILKAEQRPRALAIPIEAVPPGSKTVYVVNARSEVTERQVKFGIETATKYEVLSGLEAGDLVMIGNPMQLKTGQKVEARLNALLEQP